MNNSQCLKARSTRCQQHSFFLWCKGASSQIFSLRSCSRLSPPNTSQSLTLRSMPPVASNREPGLNWTALTSPSCASCKTSTLCQTQSFSFQELKMCEHSKCLIHGEMKCSSLKTGGANHKLNWTPSSGLLRFYYHFILLVTVASEYSATFSKSTQNLCRLLKVGPCINIICSHNNGLYLS